jgi:hypothetical protein
MDIARKIGCDMPEVRYTLGNFPFRISIHIYQQEKKYIRMHHLKAVIKPLPSTIDIFLSTRTASLQRLTRVPHCHFMCTIGQQQQQQQQATASFIELSNYM